MLFPAVNILKTKMIEKDTSDQGIMNVQQFLCRKDGRNEFRNTSKKAIELSIVENNMPLKMI